ncbi:beta strand repeat-containing protein, partial [Rhizobium sp. TRM95796]|uniref:beta strand repeat-containing protein n=1 Tax=Rhizobium sp. TRM95796 TaxID=2979862 RepID=UPI0021E9A372
MGDTYDLIDSGYYPNTAPTLAISPETSTSADTGLTVAIADLGSDADGDDISLGNLTVTSGDAIVFTDADGALVVIPTGLLAEGDTDTVTIGYSLNDGTDLTSGGALTVTVTGTGSSTLHLTLSQAKGAYAANYTTLSSLGDAFTSITIHATGTEIAALSDTDLAQFKDLGVTLLDASDDAISLTLAQLTAMNTAGIGLSAADAVTLSATATDISALDADDAAMIAAMGANTITVSSGGAGGGGDVVLDASVAVSLADVSGLAITGASSVTITGDGDTIANVYGDDIQALATLGVTAIDVSDNAVAIDIAEAEAYVSAGIAFAADDTVAVSLWSTDLASFGTQKFNEFKDLGVDILNVSGNRATVSLAFAQALAARNIGFSSEDAITITLSASELAALDADDIDDLDDLGADVLDLSDNAGSVTLAQAVLLSAAGIAFAAEDTITLADTGANLAGLTSVGISDLKLLGVSVIDASDNAVDLSFAQLADLKSVLIGLTYSDAVTLSDTAANLSALDTDDAATIAAMGVDAITVSDSGAVSLDAAAALALSAVSGLAVSGAMSVTVTGTGATIAAFDADDMTALGALGVTVIDATDDAATLTLDQAQAIADAGIVFDDGDVVTVALSTAELAALGATDLDALDAVGVDVLDMTGNVATLTLAQAAALTAAGIAFASDDVVTIGDTGANLAGLDSATIADLATLGVTTLDATDNAVALSLAQLSALKTAGIGLTPSDVVSLTISAADMSNLGSDDATLIADFGVDTIALSDTGVVILNAAVAAQLLTIADLSVTGQGSMAIAGTSAEIAAFDITDINRLAEFGVSRMNVSEDAVTLTFAQSAAYASNEIGFSSGDTVTIALTATEVTSLDTDTIDDVGAWGADVFDLVGDAATLTLAQAKAVADAGIVFDDGDVVTVALSTTELAALGATDLDALDAIGVDVLDMTGNVATLTLAQAAALTASGIAFASDDVVTIGDTGANLAGLDSASIADLATLGVTTLDASDNAVALSLAQLSALKTAGIGLTPSDVVSLTISAADLSNLGSDDATLIADFGVDTIALSDTGVVILNAAVAAQLLTIADLSVTGQGSMAIAGTSAEIAAFDITDINRLAEFGVSRMNVSEDAVTLTFAQSAAYASNEIGFSSGDTVTIALTATEVTSLDTDTIDDVGAWGADAFDVIGDAATLTLAQAQAVAEAGIVFDDGDVVTVALSTTELAALGATDLDALDAVGVDVLDMTGNAATLTLAQAAALTAAGIAFAGDDTITIADTGAHLAGLDSATIADLAALGVTTLDATDNTVGLSLAQLSALKTAGIGLTPSDVVSLTISAADMSNLGSDDVTLIADFGVDKIALSDTGGVALPAGVAAQLLTIADLSVTGLGSMTVVGNAALIGGFSAADIAGLAGL